MSNRLLTVLVRFFALIVLMVCLLTAALYLELNRPISHFNFQETNSYIFDVSKGSNLNQVTAYLGDQNIIAYPKLITLWAIINDQQGIKAGEYELTSADTPLTILQKLSQGQVVSRSVTFPEGWNFKQWIDHLATFEQFSYLTAKTPTEILQESEIPLRHPEGWFYPDTYSFTKQDEIADILNQAYRRMRIELERAWKQKKQGLPYQSAYEVLIMASIIEKETGRSDEREAIAGVFVRRLEKGMRLQTDPTVIYGLGEKYDGDLRKKDLLQLTAYNTYRIDGLPPTPIAMPGLASIKAALNPLEGNSLYFVAKGDGSHQFSDTMADHLKAVRYYQIEKRVSNYQSAPQ
jgi:UPF0755 protein